MPNTIKANLPTYIPQSTSHESTKLPVNQSINGVLGHDSALLAILGQRQPGRMTWIMLWILINQVVSQPTNHTINQSLFLLHYFQPTIHTINQSIKQSTNEISQSLLQLQKSSDKKIRAMMNESGSRQFPNAAGFVEYVSMDPIQIDRLLNLSYCVTL